VFASLLGRPARCASPKADDQRKNADVAIMETGMAWAAVATGTPLAVNGPTKILPGVLPIAIVHNDRAAPRQFLENHSGAIVSRLASERAAASSKMID
jgi:hypothetical protein